MAALNEQLREEANQRLDAAIAAKQEQLAALQHLVEQREKHLAALELRLQHVELGAEQQAKSAAAGQGQAARVVRLDVGGRHFTTRLATLTSEADSKLAAMFDHHDELEQQGTNDGRVFIDRDPVTFALILDWLRTSDLPTGLSADLERRLRRDAAHYGLARLVAALQKSDVDVGGDARRYEKITVEQLWQLTNEKSNVQLAGVDLRGVCLSGLDLTRARFTRCNLEGADFEWANLNEARLIDCNLNRAMMAGVNLSKANLSSSSCVGTNLKGAVLEGAMCANTVFQDANLAGADLTKMNGGAASFAKANLTGANLTKMNGKAASFENANLSGANLEEMNGKTATFDSSNLTGASLKFMHADRASFQNTNLRGANIYSLSASKANLQGADLTGATIEYAQFPNGFSPEV